MSLKPLTQGAHVDAPCVRAQSSAGVFGHFFAFFKKLYFCFCGFIHKNPFFGYSLPLILIFNHIFFWVTIEVGSLKFGGDYFSVEVGPMGAMGGELLGEGGLGGVLIGRGLF